MNVKEMALILKKTSYVLRDVSIEVLEKRVAELVFDETKHPRDPKGESTGGQWTSGNGEVASGNASDLKNSEAFKKWFGESKVVDADGNPLIVYHGTQGDFTEFAPKKTGHGEIAYNSSIYFTSKKENASFYANVNNMKGNIYEVYLSIQKPKIVHNVKDMRYAEKTAKKNGFDGIIAKGIVDGGVVSDIYIAFYPEQIRIIKKDKA